MGLGLTLAAAVAAAAAIQITGNGGRVEKGRQDHRLWRVVLALFRQLAAGVAADQALASSAKWIGCGSLRGQAERRGTYRISLTEAKAIGLRGELPCAMTPRPKTVLPEAKQLRMTLTFVLVPQFPFW